MFPRLNNNPARHLYILEPGYDRPIGHYARGIAFHGNRGAKAQTRRGSANAMHRLRRAVPAGGPVGRDYLSNAGPGRIASLTVRERSRRGMNLDSRIESPRMASAPQRGQTLIVQGVSICF